VPPAGLHRDVQADVGEVDRQPGVLDLRQGLGQLHIVGGDPLGDGGVGDELPEEVHAGRDAPLAEAGNDSEQVLDGLASDVAAGRGIGTPLQGRGATQPLFEALVGDELEQQPPAERGHESPLHAERCDQAEPTADARGSPTAVSGDDARLQDRHADHGPIPHVGQAGNRLEPSTDRHWAWNFSCRSLPGGSGWARWTERARPDVGRDPVRTAAGPLLSRSRANSGSGVPPVTGVRVRRRCFHSRWESPGGEGEVGSEQAAGLDEVDAQGPGELVEWAGDARWLV
jgi:hypothetical protein